METARHGSANGIAGFAPLHSSCRRHHPSRQQQTTRVVWTLFFVVMATVVRTTHAEPMAGKHFYFKLLHIKTYKLLSCVNKSNWL